ncbi:MAG: hypothetical protein C7B47_16140 [Sulfobacillus thermosulfidooxidans]|uniref:DUF429 domain-containing protein n=1 Tax=Sulfobacillus thermosulfidooxidans TaxID=28034 RepID=A0A2T2WLL1_SULTH|nr:MAG: hypothetical protein C7B47_16140 [Sulfobacillus thermosulfidooxidans]
MVLVPAAPNKSITDIYGIDMSNDPSKIGFCHLHRPLDGHSWQLCRLASVQSFMYDVYKSYITILPKEDNHADIIYSLFLQWLDNELTVKPTLAIGVDLPLTWTPYERKLFESSHTQISSQWFPPHHMDATSNDVERDLDKQFKEILKNSKVANNTRTVDSNVLSPIADKIFRTILQWRAFPFKKSDLYYSPQPIPQVQAARIHETFPKVSLALWGLTNSSYKGQGQESVNKEKRKEILRQLFNKSIFHQNSYDAQEYADNDKGGNLLDALVCAIALAECCTGQGCVLTADDGWAYLGGTCLGSNA